MSRRPRRYRRWQGYPPQYPYAYPPPIYPPAPQSPEEELAALEDYKGELEEEKTSIEQEISDVEARINELKSMIEQRQGPQLPGP
jgi:hypothetical protein